MATMTGQIEDTAQQFSEIIQPLHTDPLKEALPGESQDQEKLDKRFKNLKGTLTKNHKLNSMAKELLTSLDTFNVYLNQVGEREDFKSTLTNKLEKAEWANRAIASNVHKEEPAQTLVERLIQSIFK